MVSRIERQFIIDNPHLKSNVIKKFINASTTHINKIKKDVYGKIPWFHSGNKYPYLNKVGNYYLVRYATIKYGRTDCLDRAIEFIDEMIELIERDGSIKSCEQEIVLPPLMQIARKLDFKETVRSYKK